MQDPRVMKWMRWIKRIERDVSAAIQQRRLWHEVRRMWRCNKALHVPSEAHGWIAQMYAGSASLTVRRQLDQDKRAVSLAKLLGELACHAPLVTRAGFVGLGDVELQRRILNSTFDRFARKSGTHLRASIPSADLQRLELTGQAVREVATRRFAHADKTGPRHEPTWNDLDRAIDQLERVTVKYLLLLTGASYVGKSLVAHRQFDHETIWRRPWLRAQWGVLSWPVGAVHRQGELTPSPDYLTVAEHRRLVSRRARLVSELQQSFDREREAPSPLRRALESRGLPASDAAVQWLRDELQREGAVWTTPNAGE